MAVAVRTSSAAVPVPAPALRRQRRRRAERRHGVAGGVLWIVVLAMLLGGVVALNVAVLDLNVRLDRLSRERVDLKASTAQLESQLSSAGATPRIGAAARNRLGLVQAGPEQTTYVTLGK
jgi:cell division protein FtsL